MKWKPCRRVEIISTIGTCLDFRWQCDQFILACTAYLCIHRGVNISQTVQKVIMKCKRGSCYATTVFGWQPGTGLWKLNRFLEHEVECYGEDMSIGTSASALSPRRCYSAYTPHQIARAIMVEAAEDPNLRSRAIIALVKAKEIYRRQLPLSHYRSVRKEILRHMDASRAVEMAATDGYISVIKSVSHSVQTFTLIGVEMKYTLTKAAKYTFRTVQKDK